MIGSMEGEARKHGDWGPGIVGVRCIMTGCYGIRVSRDILSQLRDVPDLKRPNPSSDLFCVHVDGVHNFPECAVRRFREIMAREGLGKLFGCAAAPKRVPVPAARKGSSPARKASPAKKKSAAKAPARKTAPTKKKAFPRKAVR